MALIYEIIDTQGKVIPSDWKRLINFSLRNLDSISIIKNFLSSDNYIYSHPDNIKSKIIEKILDDSNLQNTLNTRKEFWIKTRIERFGKDCFMKRKEIIDNQIENTKVEKIDKIDKIDKINSVDIKENNEIIENISNEPISNEDTTINSKEIVIEENSKNIDTTIDDNQKSITSEDNINFEESIEDERKSNNNINSKEITENIPDFSKIDFKFDNIIYNGLDDLINNIDSDISKEIITKALNGKLNKNYKKKYKEIFSKLFIFKDNEWILII